jgi:hypothetical protein
MGIVRKKKFETLRKDALKKGIHPYNLLFSQVDTKTAQSLMGESLLSRLEEFDKLSDEERNSRVNKAFELLKKKRPTINPLELQGAVAHIDQWIECPQKLADFFVRLTDNIKPDSMITAWGIPNLVATVVEALNPQRLVALDRKLVSLEWTKALVEKEEDDEFGHSDPLHRKYDTTMESQKAEFDLAICTPPLGLSMLIDGRTQKVVSRLVLHYSELLSSSGTAIFIVALPDWRRIQNILPQLKESGSYIDACFDLPSGFWSGTAMPTKIVVVRRGDNPSNIFVAELLLDSPEGTEEVLLNYRKRQEGSGHGRTGALIDVNDFFSVDVLARSREWKESRKKLPNYNRSLGDVCTITMCPPAKEEIEEKTNRFFFRISNSFQLVGSPWKKGKTETDIQELPSNLKQSRWFQIDPNLEHVTSRYLNFYLKSTLFQKTLEGTFVGGTLFNDYLPPRQLKTIDVWLPNLEDQTRSIDLIDEISILKSQISDVECEITSRPDLPKEHIKQFERITKEDTYEDWIETLPQPLASILWEHKGLQEDSVEQRIDCLHHFFEALAILCATINLSALRKDCGDLGSSEVLKKAIDTMPPNLSLQKASFGTWMHLFQNIAKHARTELNKGEEEREQWQNNFACDDIELVKILTNKELVRLLHSCNQLRNEWKGHGPRAGAEEKRQRDSQLMKSVNEFRVLVGNRWAQYPLVLAESSKYMGENLNRHRVKNVMGTRLPLVTKEYEMRVQLEAGQLHFLSPKRHQNCALGKFPIRMGARPTQEAGTCYFFSRTAGEEMQFHAYSDAKANTISEKFETSQSELEILLSLARGED